MRISTITSGLIAAVALLAVGCAGPGQKLGRGLRNTVEPIRMGEMRRSLEQSALLDGSGGAFSTGLVKGLNRTVCRTFAGVYETITFPIPSYDPLSKRLAHPVYPDSFKPGLLGDPLFSPDSALGFHGGDVAPIVPGSRFRVFDY